MYFIILAYEWSWLSVMYFVLVVDVDKDVAIIAVMIITACVTMIILHAVFVRRQNLCAAIYYW
jgi:hypothetical protein